MELIEKIDKCDVISFDIFDTLIKRNVKNPVDVFDLIEKIYNKDNNQKKIKGFKEERILAEKRARAISNKEEIELEDIYRSFPNNFNEYTLTILKNIELEIELNISVGNKEIIKYFNYAKEKKKKIVITSDMYLPEDVVKGILNKNCISGYDKLYLSSKVNATKNNGTLFKIICNDNKCQYNDILHIGDNIIADIKRAKQLGINTFYVKGTGEGKLDKKIINKIKRNFKKSNIEKNLIEAFIKNNYYKNYNEEISEFLYNWGYKTLGPVLYGYLNQIHELSNKYELNHICFFARDGYLLKKAYEECFFKSKRLPSSYLLVSRKALIIPTLRKEDELEVLLKKLGINKNITLGSLIKKLSIDASKYIEIMEKEKLSFEYLLDFNSEYDRINKFYGKIKDILFDEIYEQRELLQQYLKQEKVLQKKSIAVVDLGWRGSLQFALDKILEQIPCTCETYGFYLGLNSEFKEFKKEGMKGLGYLFDPTNNYFESSIWGGIGVVEMVFSAPHGSVVGYKKDMKSVEGIYDEFEYSNLELEKIQKIQKGALKFIEDFSSFTNELNIEISKEALSKELIRFLSKPTKKEADIFGEFSFYDFDKTYLAKPKSFISYIFFPKKFILDFRNSGWKIGFLKRLIKIKLPYYFIYSKMRESSRRKL